MPKRVESHKLEDESKRRFQNIIPNEWVYREIKPDYGLDIQIELFDKETQKGTGIQFYVQLKAKEKIEGDCYSLRLPIEHIEYYRSLNLPVMIVVYEKHTEEFYYRWFWEYDLYYAGKGKKTKLFKIYKEESWNKATPKIIAESLNIYFDIIFHRIKKPIQIYIEIKSDYIESNFATELFINEIIELGNEYKNYFQISNEKKISTFIYEITDEHLFFSLLKLPGTYLHSYFQENKQLVLDELLSDLILFLNFGLAYYDIINSSIYIEVIKKYCKKSHLIKIPHFIELCIGIIVNYYNSETFFDFLLILIDINISDEYLLFCFMQGMRCNKFEGFKNAKGKEIIFINALIEKVKNNGQPNIKIGTLYYNLGSVYRTKKVDGKFIDLDKAKKYYFLASRYDNEYKKRFYFLRELAAIYYYDKRYCSSSVIYKKALEIKEDIDTIALFADTLFYSKRFKEAIEIFDKYMGKSKKPAYEWLIKKFLSKEILRLNTIKESKIVINILNNIDTNFYDDVYWVNEGIKLHKKELYRTALLCYLIAAMNNFHNLTALINAIFLSLIDLDNIKELGFILIRFTYEYNKNEFFKAIADTFPDKNNVKALKDFLHMIIQLIDRSELKDENDVTLRIITDNGTVIEIE